MSVPVKLLFLILFWLSSNTEFTSEALSEEQIQTKCEQCRKIIEKFHEMLKKTDKSNFGGGNTAWEEKSLGSYFFSETRLYEITENIYHTSDTKIASLLGQYEDDVEEWWFKKFKIDKKHISIFTHLCINTIKVCCANGTYGSTCQPCPGGKDSPCFNNGKCDKDGFRMGTGACSCNDGYSGELCDKCGPKFYKTADNSDDDKKSFAKCESCHAACETNCTGRGPKNCVDCTDGWNEEDGGGCTDINECEEEEDKCLEGEFCVNKPGKFVCDKCDASCNGCNSAGPLACKQCAELYYKDEKDLQCRQCHPACANSCSGPVASDCDACKEEGWVFDKVNKICIDVDECASTPCTENEYCINTEGSYNCNKCHKSCGSCINSNPEGCKKCASGYEKKTNNEVELCQDIDECSSSEQPCSDKNAECVNTVGSFSCDCKKLFEFDEESEKCIVKGSKNMKNEEGDKENANSDDSLKNEL